MDQDDQGGVQANGELTASGAEPDGSAEQAPGQEDELVRRVAGIARGALELGVGLGVLGILRFRSERPRLEAELERLGLPQVAGLSRRVGELIDRGMALVMGQSD
ncbi:MAG: hypothetical protein QOJ19_857 [Acidimicrobiia bacterium]|jgi:hypothetical protein|nr:hypothetical protein [Acidimicrobiia bacterium]